MMYVFSNLKVDLKLVSPSHSILLPDPKGK